MFTESRFISGMAAGIIVGAAIGTMTQSKQVKTMYRRFMRSPVGHTLRNISNLTN